MLVQKLGSKGKHLTYARLGTNGCIQLLAFAKFIGAYIQVCYASYPCFLVGAFELIDRAKVLVSNAAAACSQGHVLTYVF